MAHPDLESLRKEEIRLKGHILRKQLSDNFYFINGGYDADTYILHQIQKEIEKCENS